MFAAPELVKAQSIEMLRQFQIALKLQGRVFADRVMRCQECAEPDTRHQEFPVVRFMQFRPSHRSQIPKEVATGGCLVRPIWARAANPAYFSQIAIDGNRLARGRRQAPVMRR